MVVRVVPVLAALEQRAELDRLVRFVVVHRARVESGQAKHQAGSECDRHEGAEAPARHFGHGP